MTLDLIGEKNCPRIGSVRLCNHVRESEFAISFKDTKWNLTPTYYHAVRLFTYITVLKTGQWAKKPQTCSLGQNIQYCENFSFLFLIQNLYKDEDTLGGLWAGKSQSQTPGSGKPPCLKGFLPHCHIIEEG